MTFYDKLRYTMLPPFVVFVALALVQFLGR